MTYEESGSKVGTLRIMAPEYCTLRSAMEVVTNRLPSNVQASISSGDFCDDLLGIVHSLEKEMKVALDLLESEKEEDHGSSTGDTAALNPIFTEHRQKLLQLQKEVDLQFHELEQKMAFFSSHVTTPGSS